MKLQESSQLMAGEYQVAGQWESNEVASARWEFIKALQQELPSFFERLRKDVYPRFARLAGRKPGYWEPGWAFSTWQVRSDRNNRLTPYLLAWAQQFNLAGEVWILEGALQTLRLWHQDREWRTRLDIQGFRRYVCGPILLPGFEHSFKFEDSGWDPQLLSWRGYRADVRKRFNTELSAYEQRMRALIEGRGAQRATSHYSVEHFEWLALYHCGGWSLDKILNHSPHAGHKTTISKGLHKAARLAGLKVRAKRGKLKSA